MPTPNVNLAYIDPNSRLDAGCAVINSNSDIVDTQLANKAAASHVHVVAGETANTSILIIPRIEETY